MRKVVKADYPDQDSGVRSGAAARGVKHAPMPKPKPAASKKHGPLRKR